MAWGSPFPSVVSPPSMMFPPNRIRGKVFSVREKVIGISVLDKVPSESRVIPPDAVKIEKQSRVSFVRVYGGPRLNVGDFVVMDFFSRGEKDFVRIRVK